MIEKIIVTNHLGDTITMEMRFPESSGFLIRSVGGLGPSKAEINQMEVSVLDGSFFNSSRVVSKDITLELGFLEEPTIETVRQKSYKYFPIKKPVKLEIVTSNRTAYIYGHVESNEPNIFSKQQTTIIVIKCQSAYFLASDSGNVFFGSLNPVFEFPFSNESLVDPLINFGDIVYETSHNIYYTGDADVGMVFNIHSSGLVSGLTIYKPAAGQSISLDSAIITSITGADISAGDDIILSTIVGGKYVKLIRGGIEYNILNALGKFPNWFKLERGDNLFSYSATLGETYLQFGISFNIVYEGM